MKKLSEEIKRLAQHHVVSKLQNWFALACLCWAAWVLKINGQINEITEQKYLQQSKPQGGCAFLHWQDAVWSPPFESTLVVRTNQWTLASVRFLV